MTMGQKIKKVSSRVDFQVIFIVTVYIFITILLTSRVYWGYTMKMMVDHLTERVESVARIVDSSVKTESFYEINEPSDMETELYKETRDILLELRDFYHFMYIYTAKVNEEGDLVYVVDGLEEEFDFRYPNDLIENEIVPKLMSSLYHDSILCEDILETDWGYIFVAYIPIHNELDEIIGVVGIEFDAGESYETYLDLKEATFVIGIYLLVSGAILSAYLFRRITNPLPVYHYGNGGFSGKKHRNPYEVEMNHVKERGNLEKVSVILVEINGLKEVNDRLGQGGSERYFRLVEEQIFLTKSDVRGGYRSGGFVIFVEDMLDEELSRFVEICSSRVRSQKRYHDMRCSIVCGYAVFDPLCDKSLEDTVHRGFELMCLEKEKQREGRER